MADRNQFYYDQLVTSGDLNGSNDKLEKADQNIVADLGLVGITSGLTLSPASIPNLTLRVGPGVAYDSQGRRIRVPNEVELNLAQDENGVNTVVATPGNSRVLSIFLAFRRDLSDEKVDGNSATVYYQQNESYSLGVVAGAEAPSPAPPPLGPRLLLGDVNLAYGQAAVDVAHISVVRRQFTIRTTSGTQIRVGTLGEAIQLLADGIGALVAISDNTGPDDGATRVGMDAVTTSGGTVALAQGTVRTGLQALAQALDTTNGTVATKATSSVLAATGGSALVGFAPGGGAYLTANNVQAALRELDSGWGHLDRENGFLQLQRFTQGFEALDNRFRYMRPNNVNDLGEEVWARVTGVTAFDWPTVITDSEGTKPINVVLYGYQGIIELWHADYRRAAQVDDSFLAHRVYVVSQIGGTTNVMEVSRRLYQYDLFDSERSFRGSGVAAPGPLMIARVSAAGGLVQENCHNVLQAVKEATGTYRVRPLVSPYGTMRGEPHVTIINNGRVARVANAIQALDGSSNLVYRVYISNLSNAAEDSEFVLTVHGPG